MKRICFLMDSIFSIGGVQRVTAVIAKEVAKRHHVTIVTLEEASSMDTTLYGLNQAAIDYRFFSYPATRPWKEHFCKAYSYLYRKVLPQTRRTSAVYAHSSFPAEKRNALAQELYEGHYDVIIGVHAPLAVRLAACKPQLQGVKLIGWIHNSYQALFGQGSRYMGPELRRHCEWQLEKLDDTVVLCHNDARQYHFPTHVIYNPLTLTPGKTGSGERKKFLAVGRFAPQHKGFDLLIEAFRQFADTHQEWTLDLVGEGTEEPLYRRMIAEYGLEQRVKIHPFTNDIQSYYSAASVYVLSSRWEGMPLVLMEAMAHGLPVISSDLPVSQEIMGDFALYFENGNAGQLARCMAEATRLNWPEKSAKALSIARQYQTDAIITQWWKLLKS